MQLTQRDMTAQAPNSLFDTSSEAQRAKRLGVRGDRSKLAQRFVTDAYLVWEEQGEAALRRFIFHDPGGFAKMVAGLLPQKLEITHPTDGLTDDRLSILLQMAERMAQRLSATDENRLIDVTPEEGGGGPDRDGDAAGEGCPSPDRAAENPEAPQPHNSLEAAEPQLHNTLETEQALDSTAQRLIATESATAMEREESTYAMQPPVGKPFATLEHDEKRANVRKLSEPDIDPASLF